MVKRSLVAVMVAPLAKKIQIPTVCIPVGIKCMTPYEMLRRERARFVLGATR